jgi:hypothetical protein
MIPKFRTDAAFDALNLVRATNDANERARTSRRAFVRVALSTLVATPLLAACRAGEPSCTDLSALTPAERDLRLVTLGYLEKSPDPTQTCGGCVQYGEAKADDPGGASCGRCQIVRGPISPRGRCKRWVAKGPKPA